MGDPSDPILEKLKEKFNECGSEIPQGILSEEFEDKSLYLCAHKIEVPENERTGADEITHSVLFITSFENISNYLDEWIISTMGKNDYKKVNNDRGNMCIIPLSLFFNENGDIRENTITFTNTRSSYWSFSSGWNDWGIKIKITDNDLDIYNYSMEPRGINGDDIQDDVVHTRYSITMGEYEIIELYNRDRGKDGIEFDYWSP